MSRETELYLEWQRHHKESARYHQEAEICRQSMGFEEAKRHEAQAQTCQKRADTVRQRLWEECFQPTVRRVAGKYVMNTRGRVEFQDLMSEAFLKFDELLQHPRYDLSLEGALRNLLSRSLENRFLDICFPDRRKNATEGAEGRSVRREALSLDALAYEIVADDTTQERFLDREAVRYATARLIREMQAEIEAAPESKQASLELQYLCVQLLLTHIQCGDPPQQGDIAQITGLSHGRVSQIKTKMIERLKTFL